MTYSPRQIVSLVLMLVALAVFIALPRPVMGVSSEKTVAVPAHHR